MSIGFQILQLELAEEAVERYRLERQIADLKRKTAVLRSTNRLVEQRPRHGRFRKITFEEAMGQLERNGHATTAARLRLAREG
jgi:hypothetical protein